MLWELLVLCTKVKDSNCSLNLEQGIHSIHQRLLFFVVFCTCCSSSVHNNNNNQDDIVRVAPGSFD